jgi:hypothetical protein
MAELVDAHDSKSCTVRCAGSIPALGTNPQNESFEDFAFYAHLYFSIYFLGISSFAGSNTKVVE